MIGENSVFHPLLLTFCPCLLYPLDHENCLLFLDFKTTKINDKKILFCICVLKSNIHDSSKLKICEDFVTSEKIFTALFLMIITGITTCNVVQHLARERMDCM